MHNDMEKKVQEDARKDLLKVLHYGMIALYVHDKEKVIHTKVSISMKLYLGNTEVKI